MFQSLTELLSLAIANQAQSHRASFFILSNPISRKIVSLLYIRDKPLRHGGYNFMAHENSADFLISRFTIRPSLPSNTQPLHPPVFH